jgi:hypothetical protein
VPLLLLDVVILTNSEALTLVIYVPLHGSRDSEGAKPENVGGGA